jgi:hypothetical protein
VRSRAQPVELLVGGAAAELLAQCFWCVHDQGFELPDGFGAGDDRALAGCEHDAHRFAVAAGAWRGQVVAGQCLAGCANGVQVVGLGAVAACRAGWAVDLDDPFAAFQQMGREPGAEAAGALDGPDAGAGCVLVGECDDAPVAHGVGSALVLRDDRASLGDHGSGVGVAVGVDADDVVDLACQHGHAVPPSVEPVGVGTGLDAVTARQDCDEARPSGRPGF